MSHCFITVNSTSSRCDHGFIYIDRSIDVFFQLFESVIPDSCDDLFLANHLLFAESQDLCPQNHNPGLWQEVLRSYSFQNLASRSICSYYFFFCHLVSSFSFSFLLSSQRFLISFLFHNIRHVNRSTDSFFQCKASVVFHIIIIYHNIDNFRHKHMM